VLIAPAPSSSGSPSALDVAFGQVTIPPAVASATDISLASAVLNSAAGVALEWADALILLATVVALLLIRGPLRGRRLFRNRKPS
jgi:hypothetical protein